MGCGFHVRTELLARQYFCFVRHFPHSVQVPLISNEICLACAVNNFFKNSVRWTAEVNGLFVSPIMQNFSLVVLLMRAVLVCIM